MRRSHKYEAILLNSDCLPISVNKFQTITKLCSWLAEVDLDLVDCDIYRVSDNYQFDPVSLLEVWNE